MKETLIVFGTRYGATEEVAAEIQKILEKEYDQHVEIWNLKDWRACPDLSDFNNVILGSGIENEEWTENAEKYLKNDFSDKKLAVFVCSGFAGHKDLYDYAYENFLKKTIEKYPHIKPVSIEAFGGRIPTDKYPDIADERLLARLPKHQLDNRDWDKIKEWAHKLGEVFSE
ncbi:MAG: flavodoxin domain-containing protein [Candidatus Heimdallarchaeaceae archaeon]